jgi:hypothetical protein
MSHRSLILVAFALLPSLTVGCHCAHRPFLLGDCCNPCPAPCGPACGPGPVIAASPGVPFGFGGPVGTPVGAGPVGGPGCASCGSSPLVGMAKGLPAGYPGVPPVIAASGPTFGPAPVAPAVYGPGPIATTPPQGSVFTGPPTTTVIPPPMVTPDPKH